MILEWVEAPYCLFDWIGPTDTAPPVRSPSGAVLAAVVGPPGDDGPPGPPGTPGDGATDPGDLTLIFDNQLI